MSERRMIMPPPKPAAMTVTFAFPIGSLVQLKNTSFQGVVTRCSCHSWSSKFYMVDSGYGDPKRLAEDVLQRVDDPYPPWKPFPPIKPLYRDADGCLTEDPPEGA